MSYLRLMNLFIFLYSLLIVFFGLFIFSKPQLVASKLKDFYRNYPPIRYTKEKKLTSRPIFIRVAGIVIISVGLVVFVMSIL